MLPFLLNPWCTSHYPRCKTPIRALLTILKVKINRIDRYVDIIQQLAIVWRCSLIGHEPSAFPGSETLEGVHRRLKPVRDAYPYLHKYLYTSETGQGLKKANPIVT